MLARLNRTFFVKFFSTEAISLSSKSIVTDQLPKPTKHFKHMEYNPWQAIHLVKVHSLASFDQTVDLVIRINVNPKNGEQIVRGSAVMPAGIGKQTIVAIIANEQQRDMCKQAGADIVNPGQILKQIKSDKIQFDRLFTTPELVADLKPFAKLLGPRGLMPNLKVGTLITKEKMGIISQYLVEAIKQAKAGQVTFRVDSGKNVHAPMGKVSFSENQLLDNMESFVKTLLDKKPAAVKGKYFLQAYLKSTMGPRWKLKIESIDPRHRMYIMDMR